MDRQLPLNFTFLMTLEADLELPSVIGDRRIVGVSGGRVSGLRLSGRLIRGGGDWMTVRADGTMALDVRISIETDDGELVYANYSGRLIPGAGPFTMDRSKRGAIDPATYYFRTAPMFETGSVKYGWMNNIVAVGVGRLTEAGVAYSVYEIN